MEALLSHRYKKTIKVPTKQMLKLAAKLQDDAVLHSQSMFTYNVIFTSIQGKNSQSRTEAQ